MTQTELKRHSTTHFQTSWISVQCSIHFHIYIDPTFISWKSSSFICVIFIFRPLCNTKISRLLITFILFLPWSNSKSLPVCPKMLTQVLSVQFSSKSREGRCVLHVNEQKGCEMFCHFCRSLNLGYFTRDCRSIEIWDVIS